MGSTDPAGARTLRVRDGDPWPQVPVALGQTVVCPDGRRVRVDALRGVRDQHGAFVHLVTVTAADEQRGAQAPERGRAAGPHPGDRD